MSNKKLKNLLIDLWLTLENRRKIQVLIAVALMFLAAATEMMSIGAIIPFISVFAESNSIAYHLPVINKIAELLGFEVKNFLFFTFIFLVVTSAFTRICSVWFSAKLSYGIGSDMCNQLYRKILSQKYSHFIEQNSSDLIALVSKKANNLAHDTVYPIMVVMSTLMMVMLVLVVLLYVQPVATLAIFFLILIFQILVIYIVKNRLKKYGDLVSGKMPYLIKILQESYGAIRDIKIDKLVDYYSKIFRETDSYIRRSQINIHLIGNLPKFLFEAMGLLLLSLFALYASSKFSLEYFMPIMGAVALGVQKLLPLFQQSYASWVSIKSNQNSLHEVLSLIKSKVDIQPKKNINQFKFTSELQIINGSYSYAKKEKTVLSGLNIIIKKGERVGIVGKSGVGKSTLLDLLMGLIDLHTGQILIDGEPIQILSDGWHSCIAHVPQNIFMVNGTILDNITFGCAVIDLQKAIFAATISEINDVIKSLPMGYLTEIGEGGVKLSGGQRQRLGIARAIYKSPSVLFLDEATSALDEHTEAKVLKNIENMSSSMTIIMISHKKSTLEMCTKIIKFNEKNVDMISVNDSSYCHERYKYS